MAKLEVCCFDTTSAWIASEAGAHRIELCDDREVGGTTPHEDWLVRCKTRHPDTPVFVMIRPRGGDFVYTEDEFDEMKKSIERLKDRPDGFVFGILKPYDFVDITRTKELVQLSAPRPCTFHKALDETPSVGDALEDVIKTGCSSILTSGGAKTASQGTSALWTLSQRAKGRIDIIAGGSIRSGNLASVHNATGAP